MPFLNYVCHLYKKNQDIWNFYGSLILNNGKLIGYFGSPWYAIVLNRSHFLILCSMKGEIAPFLNYTCYLYQDKIKTFGIFTAHCMTLNNGKLIRYFRCPFYAIVLNRSHFLILCSMKERLCLF